MSKRQSHNVGPSAGFSGSPKPFAFWGVGIAGLARVVMVTAENRILSVRNPRTGEIDAHITAASSADIAATCARLRQAQTAWGRAPLAHRIGVMKEWAERLKAHRAELVEADSIDTGGGQISKVAPDMVIGTIMRMCAIAPAIFE
ncbi:MAG: aldehyde dehydrogenase family protein, partial [Candidatus Acidiferrales bacterium]